MAERRSELIKSIVVSLLLLAALGVAIHYGVKWFG